MKNRLLEDIDDSQSGPPAPAAHRLPRAAPAPPAQSQPGEQPEAQQRPRAGVWRSRETLPPLRVEDPVPDEVAPPAQAAPPEPPEPPAAPPPRAAGIPPWPASFASREPDWPIPPPDDPLPWTERWGRKALGWAVGVAGIVAVAGAATWMYRETQVQSTLAVVAGNTPGKLPAALPAPVPAQAPPVAAVNPASPEPAWTAPPLKMLPPTPTPTPAPVVPDPIAQEAVAAAPPAVAPARAAPAPKAKRAPERRVAAVPAKKKAERRVAAAPPKKARAAPDLSWAARERERMLAQAANARVPQRPAPAPAALEQPAPEQPAPQAGAEGPLSETLRLCRAAGYHAAACMKRGCEATRFGLVCRG